MAGRVVAIGECMVELSPAGDGLLRQGFAGDTFNTAWYLRRCLPPDWQVDYLSAVGQDALSDRMLGFMATAGVGIGHITRLPQLTVGLYMIALTDGERSFAYWRGESAARHLADDLQAVARAVAGADMIVLSGITLAILPEDRRAALLDAIRNARAQGSKVAFDPNMRERLWPDRATLRRWIDKAAQVADIVLPSFDEESLLAGDATPEATLQRYLGLGVPTVVVKNGAAEVLAWHGTPHRFAPKQRSAVDTTAAGDSFNAGFLAAWLRGQNMAACLAAGADLAGQVIAQPGALVEVTLPDKTT